MPRTLIAWSVSLALGVQLLLPPPVYAQVVAYKTAPASQQPTILSAGNGVPLINIQTPSAAGVSRNTYSQFDVQQQGAILNNSRNNVQTQLGGWVQGNPWLAGGTARVILNEVISANPSQLLGYVEVAGNRAQIVIANPAGVTCNGCGFINANRVTLTTGTPILSGGNLDGYRVEGGNIRVEGSGMDASGASYTDLIARAVQINAGLWAQNLSVTTGANQVNAAHTQATPIAGSGAAPAFAVDVAQLGGMYANKITLVGTEAGVGVRNAGLIGAAVGEISISADGELQNTGKITAVTQLEINVGNLGNRGLIDGGDTRIQTGTLDNLGTGRIYGDHLAIAADTLNNAAETQGGTPQAPVIAARNRLDIGVSHMSNLGGALVFSAGDMALGKHLDGSRHATGQMDDLANVSASIEALGNLGIDVAQLTNKRTEFAMSRIVSPDLPTGIDLLAYNPALQFFWPHEETSPINWRNFVRDRYIGNIASLLGGTLDSTYRSQLEALVNAQPLSVYQDSIKIWNVLIQQINVDHPEYIATMATALSGQSFPLQTYDQQCRGGDCDYVNYVVQQRTDHKDIITRSTPTASILAGGDARINAGQLNNEYSLIEAGGNLNLTGSSLTNQGAELYLQTDTITSTHRLHWVDRDHGTTVSSTSTSTLIGSAPGLISAGGLLDGSFTDRIDNLTIRQHTAPLSSPSTTPADLASIHLNLGSLFTLSPGTTYLVETDARFAGYRNWLSSDYLRNQFAIDPALTQKRLGDGFYEQRRITEQIGQLTGRRFLEGYADDETQYRALMDAAVTVAQAWDLRPGVALSAAQVAQLTSDIVWLVETDVTLVDGSTQTVLAPQVYLQPRQGDLAQSGTLLAGKNIHLKLSGEGGRLTTSGSIAGRQIVTLEAANIDNLRGLVSGADVSVIAAQNLNLEGGAISAQSRLMASAGNDLTLKSSTTDLDVRMSGTANNVQSHVVDRVAGLYVGNAGGTLQLAAAGNITLNAAQLQSAGTTRIDAGGDLALGTVAQTGNSYARASKSWRKEQWSTDVGSAIESTGAITLSSGNDLTARAASVSSTDGALTVIAERDLHIDAGQADYASQAYRKNSKSGVASKSTSTHRDSLNTQTTIASTFSGDTLTLAAGQDLRITGSDLVATGDLTAQAGRDLAIESATETHGETHYTKKKASGIGSNGGASIAIGTRKASSNLDTQTTTARASTIGSLEGNLTLTAAQHYQQTGSDLIALQGDINVVAEDIAILDAREASRSTFTQKTQQSGLTLALSNPVISAAQRVAEISQAAGNTRDPRMQALAAGSAALTGYTTYNDLTTKGSFDPAKATGINLSLSLGSSKSKSTRTQTSDTAAGSTLAAGRDITLTATGKAAEEGSTPTGNILIQGSDVTAGHDLSLTAQNDIQLLAAANTQQLRASEKSSSASIGISVGLGSTAAGFAITASASQAKGNTNGDDLLWTNTHLTAGDTLTLKSGNDTTLRGATASGQQITADIGGNLNIDSLQDTSTYDSKHKSSGFSIALSPAGVPVGGSLSGSNSKIASDYKSVTEQSGFKAGDGGFDIQVGQDTTLKGGAITSTQSAVEQDKNRFTTGGELTLSDLHNEATYDAHSVSVTLSAQKNDKGETTPQGTSAGFGEDEGHAESTTYAAITGYAGNSTARTGDPESGVSRIFDADKVQKEIDAQVKITQAFGQQAPKAAADFAASQAADLRKQNNEEEAKKWDEGGIYRIALHTAIGGLAGGAPGALGAGAAASAAPLLNEFQSNITQSLKDAGANDKVAEIAGQLISGSTALLIGSAASGGNVVGGATAFNADFNNRQLHPDMVKAAQLKAKELAGRDGLTAEQWEKRLTQQLLYQNSDAYQHFGNDAVAESILADLARTTGIDMDARSNPAVYGNSAINAEYITQLGSSYKLAGLPQNLVKIDPVVKALTDATQIQDFLSQPKAVQRLIYDQLINAYGELPTLARAEKMLNQGQISGEDYKAIREARGAIESVLYNRGPVFLQAGILTPQEQEKLRLSNAATTLGLGSMLAAGVMTKRGTPVSANAGTKGAADVDVGTGAKGGIVFDDATSAAANRLGFDPADVKVVNGVADVPIIYTSSVSPSDLTRVTNALLQGGAESVQINSGPIINNSIASRLAKAADEGKTFMGFNVTRTGDPDNMFILEKKLK